jgi:hypothetical protein
LIAKMGMGHKRASSSSFLSLMPSRFCLVLCPQINTLFLEIAAE